MELTATRRLYVPLRHHFEQNFHVRHRLKQYGAGRMFDFELAMRDTIAAMIAHQIGSKSAIGRWSGTVPHGRLR